MSRGKQSKGICAYCGQEMTKGAMARHLSACPQRQTVIDEAQHKKVRSETLYHLRVQDAWHKQFWLDLEMRSSGSLDDLDLGCVDTTVRQNRRIDVFWAMFQPPVGRAHLGLGEEGADLAVER